MNEEMDMTVRSEGNYTTALAELRELKMEGSSLKLIYTLELFFRALFKELFLILLPSARKVSRQSYLVWAQELSRGYRVEC